MFVFIIDWLLGILVIGAIVLFIVVVNWGWYKLTNQRLWDDPNNPFGWLLFPFLMPISIAVIIGILFLIFFGLPSFLGAWLF